MYKAGKGEMQVNKQMYKEYIYDKVYEWINVWIYEKIYDKNAKNKQIDNTNKPRKMHSFNYHR